MTTMTHLIAYNAPPTPEHFCEIEAKELAAIIHELRHCTRDAREEDLNADIDAASRAAELDSKGARIFVARDEDGYYFARWSEL